MHTSKWQLSIRKRGLLYHAMSVYMHLIEENTALKPCHWHGIFLTLDMPDKRNKWMVIVSDCLKVIVIKGY